MRAQELHLTSIQNPRIKEVVKLRDKVDRDRLHQFIIEGYRELLRAVDAQHPISSLFISPSLFLGVNEGALIERLRYQGTKIFNCDPAVFKKISYRDRPDGLLGVAPQQERTFKDLEKIFLKKKAPLFVVAEAIEKPGNLGTILRSADAVGVDAMIVCDRCTDIHNPNVIRSSVGTFFTVPVIEAEGKETRKWLKQHGVLIAAATPHADKEFTEVEMTKPLAIVVGTEQIGLSEAWMKEATLQVKIPMCGVADSLNVAMATTLLLYEALRQRRLER